MNLTIISSVPRIPIGPCQRLFRHGKKASSVRRAPYAKPVPISSTRRGREEVHLDTAAILQQVMTCHGHEWNGISSIPFQLAR